MDLNLQGRKVVITGAGDGIGRALAFAFAREGAHIAVCARSDGKLHSLSKEVEGDGHLFHPADLTDLKAIELFHRKVMETMRGIDVLVNNVGGILRFADFFELTDADWEASFSLNLMPAVRLTRLFISALKKSGAPRIINISSIAAAKPGEAFPHYSAMKAALSNLTGSLAHTLAPHKILVNSVSPGPVWTQSWENEAKIVSDKTGENPREAQERIKVQMAQMVPLKRMGAPEDVTSLVLFLASDRASWITASNFTVDGGIRQDVF